MRNVCTADLRQCQKQLALQQITETDPAALAAGPAAFDSGARTEPRLR